MRKAEEFFRGARSLEELADEPNENNDAAVSLYVLAGIAASDAICCIQLGVFAHGQSHAESVGLLEKADRTAANQLRRLLEFKSKAEYTPSAAAAADLKAAGRASADLLERARRLA